MRLPGLRLPMVRRSGGRQGARARAASALARVRAGLRVGGRSWRFVPKLPLLSREGDDASGGTRLEMPLGRL